MNPVEWLENLLHSIDPTIALIALGYLACLFLIMKLMRVAAWADRRAESWEGIWRNEVRLQELRADSVGPQVTAKTLTEEGESDAR